MRAHLILSTLCAVTLFGGAALAEHPDHATRERLSIERVQREHAQHEHVTREARGPERLQEFRAHGDVDARSHGAKHESAQNPPGSEKAKAEVERAMMAKCAMASGGDGCGSTHHEGSGSQTSEAGANKARATAMTALHPYSGSYARGREMLRQQKYEAVMKGHGERQAGALAAHRGDVAEKIESAKDKQRTEQAQQATPSPAHEQSGAHATRD